MVLDPLPVQLVIGGQLSRLGIGCLELLAALGNRLEDLLFYRLRLQCRTHGYQPPEAPPPPKWPPLERWEEWWEDELWE